MPAQATDRYQQEAALRSAHRATLAEAASLTDMPTLLEEVRQVRRQLGSATLGELGPNGLAPRIAGILASARRFGFDWRTVAADAPKLARAA